MKREFTYMDDIVERVIKLLNYSPKKDENGVPYAIYNIGNNKPVELMGFIEMLEKKLGKKATKEFLPLQEGDVPETCADIDDLVRDFGFKPNTSIDEGIEKFVDWYLGYKFIN